MSALSTLNATQYVKHNEHIEHTEYNDTINSQKHNEQKKPSDTKVFSQGSCEARTSQFPDCTAQGANWPEGSSLTAKLRVLTGPSSGHPPTQSTHSEPRWIDCAGL